MTRYPAIPTIAGKAAVGNSGISSEGRVGGGVDCVGDVVVVVEDVTITSRWWGVSDESVVVVVVGSFSVVVEVVEVEVVVVDVAIAS